MPDLIRARS